MKQRKSKQPKRKETKESFNTPDAPNSNKSTLRFCLRHLRPGFDILALDKNLQADFAKALQKRGQLTWEQVYGTFRHGMGTEKLPSDQIKPGIPESLAEHEHFLVMRYSGKLPMVGFRTSDTFHVVWIEGEFDTVYDHGG